MSELAQVLDDILECSVCLNRLQDPKRLPCGHIFCEKCLVPLRAKVCPKCRQGFSTNASELPTDTTTVKLLESCKTSANRQDCRDCESHFAIQCCHCFVKLCEECLKFHMNEVLLERARFFDGNLPKDLDIFLENNDQFRAELLSHVNANVEAAREKATNYLHFHHDEVQRMWNERINMWKDSQLIDVKSVHVTQQSCMYDLYRFNAGKPDPELSQLNKLYDETEQVKAAVEQLQNDLDRTVAELVGLQWKVNEISRESRKGMEEILNVEMMRADAGPETSHSDNMSELSDDPWDSPSVHDHESERGEDYQSEAQIAEFEAESLESAEGDDMGMIEPVEIVIEPNLKKVRSKPTEVDSFEERRFRNGCVVSGRTEQQDNKVQEPPPHIALYSHRRRGLFSTPALSFSLLNALTNDEPAQFPAADDDDDDDEKQKPHSENMPSDENEAIKNETLNNPNGVSLEERAVDEDGEHSSENIRE